MHERRGVEIHRGAGWVELSSSELCGRGAASSNNAKSDGTRVLAPEYGASEFRLRRLIFSGGVARSTRRFNNHHVEMNTARLNLQ